MESEHSGEDEPLLDEDDFEEITHEEAVAQERQRRANTEVEVIADPERDYFEEIPPLRPKQEIGEYVASQGFSVPLISTLEEWQVAFDDGVAMIRSDMPQDYDGWAGLLASVVLNPDDMLGHTLYQQVKLEFYEVITPVLARALRNLDIDPAGYMQLFHWSNSQKRRLEEANQLGIDLYFGNSYQQASIWRYISGNNVRIFRDPNVDGRYFAGLIPLGQAVGGYQIGPDKHDQPLKFRKHHQPFIAKPFIDFYEQVRNLPRFDNNQCPVLELQQDEDGNIHFLQYLKTGHRLNPIEPFELPRPGSGIKTTEVRGATTSEGKEYKLYIAPKRATKEMKGQGVFIDTYHMRGLAEQYFSMTSDLVLHEAYIDFQDNHFNSAPLYRPPLAMAVGYQDREIYQKLRELVVLVHGKNASDTRPDHNVYINAHVTSNGREATIETDWQPHFEEY